MSHLCFFAVVKASTGSATKNKQKTSSISIRLRSSIFIGAADRIWTDTVLPPKDFKSFVSAIPPQRRAKLALFHFYNYNTRIIKNQSKL